jgi:xanthine dehydrogenase accessory factor
MNINPKFKDILILIKGAGDMASGVAYRLKRAGFPLIMTELPTPLMVRRAVCFGAAVYTGETTVEGIPAKRVDTLAEARKLVSSSTIPVLVSPTPETIQQLAPLVLIDAIMAKKNTGTTINDASLVIALGPGFTAGVDCHAVIETNRSHWLGRVIYDGTAQPDTRKPGEVKGHSAGRVLRAPVAGNATPSAQLGDFVKQNQIIATIADHLIRAPFDGVLRGLIHPDVAVTPGFKIGDVDPRGVRDHCFSISEKSLAVAGGVLEAILADEITRGL